MADLIQRLRDHAARHAEISRFSDEQAQWGRDLLEAAELLEQGAAVQPSPALDGRAEAERKEADQLAGLLLSHPETGETLWISGPPIEAHLGYSTLLLSTIAGDQWTLTFRLEEGNHPGTEKRANVLKGIREELRDISTADNGTEGHMEKRNAD